MNQILLYLFLAEKGLLESFENNLCPEAADYEDCLGLGNAFVWVNTKEGQAFWQSLEREFGRWTSRKILTCEACGHEL